MHAPISLTLSPTTPIRPFRQTYPRCFGLAYTPHIRPPLGRTSTANAAGVWTGSRGGIVPPVGSQTTAGPHGRSARLRTSRRPADREARASHTKTLGAYASRGLR